MLSSKSQLFSTEIVVIPPATWVVNAVILGFSVSAIAGASGLRGAVAGPERVTDIGGFVFLSGVIVVLCIHC